MEVASPMMSTERENSIISTIVLIYLCICLPSCLLTTYYLLTILILDKERDASQGPVHTEQELHQ